MRPRYNTLPMFEVDASAGELAAIVDAYKELRELADRWQRRQLERAR